MTSARLLFATMSFMSSFSTMASAQASVPDTAEVRTAATARRDVRANEAVFTLQFTADGGTATQANQRLADRADSVRRALVTLGIPRDSIISGSTWHWWPERLQVLTNQRRIPATPPAHGYQIAVDTIPLEGNMWQYRPILDTTYRAREKLEVHAGDPALVGPAIDAALALRVTDISRIRFSVSEVRQIQLDLLREATQRVTEQATVIAAASGGRLGRVLYLGTQAPDAYANRYGLESIVYSGVDAATGSTEITAPNVTVSMTVYGRWLLVPR